MNGRGWWAPAFLGMAFLLGGCLGSSDQGDHLAVDAKPDGEADAGLEVESDAGVDSELDAGLDGAFDAEVDTGLDAGFDADWGEDAGIDASPGPSLSADYGCLGLNTAPTTGEQRTFTLVIRDFQTGSRVAGLCVNVYPDNHVPASDTCSGVVTDAEGEVQVTNHGGWFAYRLFPTATTMGVVQRNVMSGEAGASVGGNSVSTTTAGLLAGLVGRQRAEGTAAFVGTIYDCKGDPVQGAEVQVAYGDSIVAEGPGSRDPMYAYFSSSNLPDANQPHTNSNGLFMAINIPVPTQGEVSQLIGCGKVDGQNVEVLGAEETPTFADTYNIVSLYPRRADGPTPAYDCQ
jgi:hypothetical protein